ncbi:hypothetical protein ALC57_00348 [Trachymyrmex cornetzi]|uniref:GIY-YIG domain-containing protein n=1 Tax=Trachymyrmex cornetzi TaxID=471704 RepID=A0A151JST6_9HYME|nr:hypothetical protein ALC57_00348 [Trachymyrmex cornetzi]
MLVVAIPQVVSNSVKRTWMYEPELEDPPMSRDREYRSRTQNRDGLDNARSRTVYRLPAVPAGSSMNVLQAQARAAPGRRHSFVEDHVIPVVIAGIGENNRVAPDDHSNVVYKINCHGCNYSYVGQTKKRTFNTRLKEHKNDPKKPSNDLSVISRHTLDHNHRMDWDNTIILDSEQSFYKRLVSEMIYIKRQKIDLNKQSDTERFPEIYPFLSLKISPLLTNSFFPFTLLSLHNFIKTVACYVVITFLSRIVLSKLWPGLGLIVHYICEFTFSTTCVTKYVVSDFD